MNLAELKIKTEFFTSFFTFYMTLLVYILQTDKNTFN